MIKRILKLSHNEFYKLVRQKITYFSIFCVVVMIVLGRIGTNYLFIERSEIGSGYLFLLISSRTIINMFGVILILIFSSLLISSEASSGTIQAVLVNPISRFEFYVSKIVIGMVFSLLILGTIFLASFIIAKINFTFGDYIENGITIYTQNEIFLNFSLCFLLLLFPIFAICIFGLLISTLTKNIGLAIGVSIGSIIIFDILKERLDISHFLFQSYIENSFELAQNLIDGFKINWFPNVFYCIGVPGIWMILMFVIGYFIFSRKNFK